MDSASDLPFSPAAERNRAPILEALCAVLPPRAKVLEVGSGTGQHAAHCAAQQPQWRWQPSDADAQVLPVITRRCGGLANVRAPLQLDLLATPPEGRPALSRYDALFCANLLHVAPWPACAALVRLAADRLFSGGVLMLYGPFEVEGEPLAPGNRAFDADLRARNPQWGLRRLGDVRREAERAGLVFERRMAMPANNLMLVWRQPMPAAD